MEISNVTSLSHFPDVTLYDAFQSAFCEYDVQIDTEQLIKMLTRRGFCKELSFGVSHGDMIVSFIFNGIGDFNGIKTAYDSGTGTLKEYRGNGLSKKIFNDSISILEENGVKRYLLEVLQHNTAAVNLYKSSGFEISREFGCYVCDDLGKLTIKKIDTNYTISEIDIREIEDFSSCFDFEPSWQNSFDSIKRARREFKFKKCSIDAIDAGFIAFEPESGDIAQLSVKSDHRRLGVASMLLQSAVQEITCGKIKIINVECGSEPLEEFCTKSGLQLVCKQYEMILDL